VTLMKDTGNGAGFVAAAVIAGVLYAAGVLRKTEKSAGSSASTAAVSLPSTLGGYLTFTDAVSARSPSTTLGSNVVKSDAATAAALSAAHGGAGAAVRTYSDRSLLVIFAVWVVRDDTPAPVVQVQDAETLGLAKPPRTIERHRTSACLVEYQVVIKGKAANDGNTFTQFCQRTGDALTVTVFGGDDKSLRGHPDLVAALVDQVWSSVR
jgi:hypothetical protein